MKTSQKINQLRTSRLYSQKDLADQLGVSIETIKEWETGQSAPDDEMIVRIADLFGVSTNELLADDQTEAETLVLELDKDSTEKQPDQSVYVNTGYMNENYPVLSEQEVQEYLKTGRKKAVEVAFGVALCILSITFPILSDSIYNRGWSGEIIGVCMMFAAIAAAVALFLHSSFLMKPFKAVNNVEFTLSDSDREKVEEELRLFNKTYQVYLILGVCLCILSVVPVIILSAIRDSLYGVRFYFIEHFAAASLFILVAFGVFCIVKGTMEKSVYYQLLKKGDYSDKGSKKAEGSYWSIVTAIYLLVSFLSGRWGLTWILFPVAALLYKPVFEKIMIENFTREKDS